MAVKRSIYLINPKFQLKFSFFVCSLVFISSLIYPITIYELIQVLAQSTGNPVIISSLEAHKTKLMIILMVVQFNFMLIIFILCIFQSHKIAGPIYKLKSFMNKIKEGNRPGKLTFRDGDHFPEIAVAFNESFGAMVEQQDKDFIYLGEINSYINNLSMIVPDDKKVILQEISKRLNEIQERFH